MNDFTQSIIYDQIKFLSEKIVSASPNLKMDENKIDAVFHKYNELKLIVHNNHVPFNEKFKMDRHKLASCLMTAIVIIKPIEYEGSGEEEKTYLERTATNQLAFLIGIYIIGAFLQYENKILNMDSIILPDGEHGHYIQHFCSLLYMNKYMLEDEKTDQIYCYIHKFAHIFYLLECNIKSSYKIKRNQLNLAFLPGIFSFLIFIIGKGYSDNKIISIATIIIAVGGILYSAFSYQKRMQELRKSMSIYNVRSKLSRFNNRKSRKK